MKYFQYFVLIIVGKVKIYLEYINFMATPMEMSTLIEVIDCRYCLQ